ncbi:hypothetical protein GCK32_014244 [Trichostrongylus colubriformis]|uniref:K Homology domain-containing protein n=1 Tax=Trichostrongylus colubriformis TaxID=6319 RepID=A0AAN8IEA3_TRICO
MAFEKKEKGERVFFEAEVRQTIQSLQWLIYDNYNTTRRIESTVNSIYRITIALLVIVVLLVVGIIVFVCVLGCRKYQSERVSVDYANEPDVVVDHEKDCSDPAPKRKRCQSVDSVSVRILVTPAEAGALLGKKGERMKAVTRENECIVRLSDEPQAGSTDRVCFVKGTVPNVIAAVASLIKTLGEVCSESDELGNMILVDVLRKRCGALPNGTNFASTVVKECNKSSTFLELEVPSKLIGAVLGRQGQMLRDIERYSLCKIQLCEKEATTDAKRMLRITGSEEHLNLGKWMVERAINEAQVRRIR